MSHVMTVRGPIDPSEVGPTLTHEHIFMDGRGGWDPSELHDRSIGERPLEPRTAGIARWNGSGIRDNLALLHDDDYDLLRGEVAEFVDATDGKGVLVELTIVGINPQPAALLKLSNDLDLHIVEGCGYYVHGTHPESLEDKSVDEIADELHKIVTEGFDGTSVRPGVIGEIGTSEELEPCEIRVLQASARVAIKTGLPINIHAHPPKLPVMMRILDVLEEAGHDLRRTSISHLDEIWDLDYHTHILKRGVITGFDSFGQDGYFSPTWKSMSDHTKMTTMVALIEKGFEDQLVMSQDICKKHYLLEFGGLGYDHVVRRIAPRLKTVFGVDDAIIDKLLVQTPRRFLTVDQD